MGVVGETEIRDSKGIDAMNGSSLVNEVGFDWRSERNRSCRYSRDIQTEVEEERGVEDGARDLRPREGRGVR